MKLYRGMRKRLAKKQIGGSWYKLDWGRHLKVGDLINTCSGWNEVITNIEYKWSHNCRSGARVYKRERFRGCYLLDIFIDNEGVSMLKNHSFMPCCSKPETPDEIIAFFKGLAEDYPEETAEVPFDPEYLDSRGVYHGPMLSNHYDVENKKWTFKIVKFQGKEIPLDQWKDGVR